MDPPRPADISALLQSVRTGEEGARDRLFRVVYEELHRIACQKMAAERADHTLQATALVHEAYLRLCKAEKDRWVNRAYFFTAAAEAMRRILTEAARRKRSEKHGGKHRRVPLDLEPARRGLSLDVLALDEALGRLEEQDARKAKVVKLRYFVGLTVPETAGVLSCSPRTVDDDWRFARAWLKREITKGDSEVSGGQ